MAGGISIRRAGVEQEDVRAPSHLLELAPSQQPSFAVGRHLAGELLEAGIVDQRIAILRRGAGGAHAVVDDNPAAAPAPEHRLNPKPVHIAEMLAEDAPAVDRLAALALRI